MRFTTAGVLATIDGERLASDELGSLKIKNRVDNLAYLAHATDRMQAGKDLPGYMQFRTRSFESLANPLSKRF